MRLQPPVQVDVLKMGFALNLPVAILRKWRLTAFQTENIPCTSYEHVRDGKIFRIKVKQIRKITSEINRESNRKIYCRCPTSETFIFLSSCADDRNY
jgi:hypothetical protein